jgi:peroxiredoxin Q/BCP
MLPTGSPIPDVTIPPTPGLCDTPTPLARLAGDGPIVIYTYPADGTPMCTRQACLIRDTMREHAEQLSAAGLRVVGVSPQDRASHERFAGRHDLPFPIIADEDKKILAALDALGPLGIPRRVIYLLLADGTIGDGLTADLRVSRHARFLQAAMAAQRAS